MVRSNHNNREDEDEEYDDEDFIPNTSSLKDGRRNDQKTTSYRSKHSETEQRRRSKINERFQILKDLIPQNDQKKDRASFLLEVIQYIQFLQEKLQAYEGTYQGWDPESTKSMPWRGNCGADNFADQSQPNKNGSVDDDHFAARTVSADLPLQQNTFETEPSRSPQGSFPHVEILASQSRPQTLNAMSLSSEGAFRRCTQSDLEESSISNAYSKELLTDLTLALGSSGVDLSQASISVQFDIKKRTSSGSTSTSFGIKDHDYLSPGNQAMAYCGVKSGNDGYDQAHKRPRTERKQ